MTPATAPAHLGATLRVGVTLPLEVQAFAAAPDAVATTADGQRVHVAFALPGERVRARVEHVAGGGEARAALVSVERASPERVAPRCRHFGACGGCHLQHLAYPAQLAHKARVVRSALQGVTRGGGETLHRGTSGPPVEWGQRNKVALHVVPAGRGAAGLVAGLHRLHGEGVFPLEECPVQDPLATDLALRAADAARRLGLAAWDAATDRGDLRGFVVRAAGGEGHVTVVARRRTRGLDRLAAALARAGAASVSQNENDGPASRLLGPRTRTVHGPPRALEVVGGLRYLASPGAFFQTSRWGAERLVEVVLRLVEPSGGLRVVDLYSGGGLLSLALARRGALVLGVEESPLAVDDAIAAARANGLETARFLRGRVEHVLHDLVEAGGGFAAGGNLQDLAQRGPAFPRERRSRDRGRAGGGFAAGGNFQDLAQRGPALPRERRSRDRGRVSGAPAPAAVVLDPPRAGCGRGVVRLVAAGLRPERVVYVSCEPESLGRDVASFAAAGYALREVEPLDMFAHSSHVEAVALLERRGGKERAPAPPAGRGGGRRRRGRRP